MSFNFGGNTEYYFAGANTEKGFVSDYSKILKDLKKIYILKGGPGTGKSRLLSDLAVSAVAKGYHVKVYLCSFDPSSLDGVIIKENGVGMFDGTSPHCIDPRYPGAVEKTVDLSNFWNNDLLSENAKEICTGIDQKSATFQSAYLYLSSAGNMITEIMNLTRSSLLEMKLNSSCERLLKNSMNDKGPIESVFVDGITMYGRSTLDTFRNQAKKSFQISDKFFISYHYLKYLVTLAENNRIHCIVCKNPLIPSLPEAIYFPEKSIYISTVCSNDLKKSTINMNRFIDSERFREIRGSLREAQRLYQNNMRIAFERLDSARKIHFRIEEIYKSAMNFKRKELHAGKIIREIL